MLQRERRWRVEVDRLERRLREEIVAQGRWMNEAGLNQGTSGNLSARCSEKMLITPTAIPYERMEPSMIAAMFIDGEYGTWEGPITPSTEWRFHLDIMKARPEVGAIVHTHATYATVLGILRKPIPACHYMVAVFGGNDVRVADYATYGTKELADNALKALDGRKGCLLANHGMIAAGKNLEHAMWLAVELETLAKQYYLSLQIPGGPVILPDEAIEDTRRAMESGYGQAAPTSSSLAGSGKARGSAT
jgi:L-fuculose-phosphate aldolase